MQADQKTRFDFTPAAGIPTRNVASRFHSSSGLPPLHPHKVVDIPEEIQTVKREVETEFFNENQNWTIRADENINPSLRSQPETRNSEPDDRDWLGHSAQDPLEDASRDNHDQHCQQYQRNTRRNQGVNYYEASLSIRAKLSIAKDILAKLSKSDRRLALFKGTCFGPWLNIQSTHGDLLLIHVMLQTQFFPEGSVTDEMWFRIGGHELRFGKEEFCLITGFRFGPRHALPEICGNPFRDRVFPHIPAHKPVKGSDLRSVFTSRVFSQISDLDAVRICLLLLLEVGFVGRQPHLVVADFLLCLVEDLESWDRYPWGSYLWELTHEQLKTALPRRQHHIDVKSDKLAKYTLRGFV